MIPFERKPKVLLNTNSEPGSQWNSLRTSACRSLSRNLCDLYSPERRWSIAVTTNFFEPEDSLFHSLKERSEIYPFRARVFPGLYGYPTLDYMYVYINIMDLGFSFPRTNRLDWKCSLPRKEPHPREMRLMVFLGFAAVYDSRSGPRSWVGSEWREEANGRVGQDSGNMLSHSARTLTLLYL